MMKKILLILLSLISFVFAQNIMSITGGAGTAGDTISVSIDINNTDAFTGFQCDVVLPDQATYVDSSANLTSRLSDHQMVATLKESGTLTIFAYSMSLSSFTGTSGSVLTFDIILGNVPGTYSLPLSNATIANSASQNILTNTVNGSFTLQAPDIYITPTSIDYGRVPLLQSSDRSFTIQNTGNASLSISNISSNFSDFEVLGSSSFTLASGNSQSVTIRFHSNTKGTYNKQITIQSDDPDEAVQTVDLSVIAYAVNELDINNMFGRSGHEATLSIDISNMEEFVGFSFDLDIPEVLTLVPGSAVLTERKTDHVISATTLSNGDIRVVAYSASNTAFTGNLGDVLTLDFMVDGQGGYYTLNFVNPVIGDSASNNIISDDYNGTLEIAAPDIHVNPSSLSYGNVSVFDTSTHYTNIYNYGSDTLNISSIIFYNPEFFTEQSLPIMLTPGQNTQLAVSYHKDTEDTVNSTMRIRSNDPDEDPYDIGLSATSFIPNIMRVDTSYMVRNDEGWLDVSIENYEDFVAFQCDVQFPPEFTYLGEAVLSDRAGSHSITAREKTGNIVNVFAYSLSQESFSDGNGVVFSLKFSAPSAMTNYNFSLDNVIIGNSTSENIMSSYENGIAQVITSGPTLSEFPNISFNEDEDTLFNISSLVSDPNTQYEDLIWTFSDYDSLSLSVIGNSLQVSVNENWFGSRTTKVKVSDDELSDSTTFSITITAINDAPIAVAGSDETNEETSLAIALSASDVDNESLTYTILDNPLHGSLSGSAPNLTYLPEVDYNGYDSLRFKVDDGELSDTAVYTIEVLAVNDRPIATSSSVETNEDNSVSITLAGSDPDGDSYSFSILVNPTNGSLTGSIPNLTYTPEADYYGPDEVQFIITDSPGAKDTGTVSITVNSINDAPVAVAGSDETNEETPLNIILTSYDVDKDELSYTILQSTVNGDLSGTPPNLTYIAEDEYFGWDSLIFIVGDGEYNDTATFTIEILPINDPPIAVIESAQVKEDSILSIQLHASDVDSEDLTFSVLDSTMHGILTGITPDLIYIPDKNYYGPDSLFFIVSDGYLSDTASFIIEVLSVNDAPVAIAGSDETYEDISLEIILYANDIDSETLTYTVLDSTLHGYLEGVAPYLTYVPNEEYSGLDSLRFKVNDGELSDTAIFNINILPVNDSPEALCQEIQVNEDSTYAFILKANDPENDELVFTILDSTVNGKLSGVSPELMYTPILNYYGLDSLRFIVNDGNTSDTGTCIIDILPVNDAPLASSSQYQIKEDSVLILILDGSDIDEDVLTFTVLDSTQNGILSGMSPDLTYVPTKDYFGWDSLHFIVNDGSLQDTGTYLIEILPVNDVPIWASIPDTSFNEDDSLKIPLTQILTYLKDNDHALTEIILSYHVPDVFQFGLIDSVLFLTAEENWYGQDSIQISASDGIDSASITWHITVIPVNDPPVFTSLIDTTLYFDADTRDTISYAELFNDIDTPDSLISISITAEDVKYEIDSIRSLLVLYVDENISLNETITITLNDGDNEVMGELSIEITEVSITIIPEDFALYPPYPNPFNPITTIGYDLPEQADINMVIYDITGKKVRTLVNASQDARSYKVIWNGLNDFGGPVASGMYICRIIARSTESTFVYNQKLLFVK